MGDQPSFGHGFASGANFHIDWWGDGPMVIRDGDRVWWFEFSDMFGPTLLKPGKAQNISDVQPVTEDDPFWRPFMAWLDGGKKCRAVKTKRGRTRFWLCHWNRFTHEARHD